MLSDALQATHIVLNRLKYTLECNRGDIFKWHIGLSSTLDWLRNMIETSQNCWKKEKVSHDRFFGNAKVSGEPFSAIRCFVGITYDLTDILECYRSDIMAHYMSCPALWNDLNMMEIGQNISKSASRSILRPFQGLWRALQCYQMHCRHHIWF